MATQSSLNKSAQSTEILTFGCRLNIYESQVIKDLSAKAGLKNTFILNTCSVTAEAERQARQSIRKLRRAHPDATIIVTGCSAQNNAQQYTEMPEVNRVIGNTEKLSLPAYLSTEPLLVNSMASVRETASHLVSSFDGKARAYLQVQNGCNHRCTFCNIPLARGPARSVPIGEIVSQARHLTDAGYTEMALTGVDITAYGEDLPGQPTLGQMIRRLLALAPDLKRLRLSSLDPVEIDEDLWRQIGDEPRLMPHLHLSLQAGDDMILKRMKRRHLRDDAIAFCQKARQLRPDVVFGADLIAGFPTETEEMFANTLAIVKDCDLTYLHVFPYSARPETPAARMPQVPLAVRKQRAAKLRQAGEAALQRFFQSQHSKITRVMIEKINPAGAIGKTDHFAPVRILNLKDGVPGDIISVRLTDNDATTMIGLPA